MTGLLMEGAEFLTMEGTELLMTVEGTGVDGADLLTMEGTELLMTVEGTEI